MTEAIFERRTRSQVTLPDDILRVPEQSPLKGARNALRNQAVIAGDQASSSKTSAETNNELLLLPQKVDPLMITKTNGKRSASPPPQGEYAHRSSSPSDGRELKRTKRDGRLEEERVVLKRAASLPRGTSSGPSINHSELNNPAVRRSGRKRSATTSKKPLSTVSESLPPTTFSPPPTAPTKGRAQSVPLFIATGDIPRIDFRNLPPSPKRSSSRSPSKDREPKLRITSTNSFPTVSKLSPIRDEASAIMDLYEASSVAGEMESDSQIPPAKQPDDVPSLIPAQESIIPPENPQTSTTKNMDPPAIPVTPTPESLNRFIPMSPLTPVPETPMPTKIGSADRYANVVEWKLNLGAIEESPAIIPMSPVPAEQATTGVGLPRPVMVPPLAPAPKLTQPSWTSSKVGGSSTGSSEAFKPGLKGKGPAGKPKNAFDLLMKKSRDDAQSKKAKLLAQKQPAAGQSSQKLRVKERMRPRLKPIVDKEPQLIAAASDEEEEKETPADEEVFSSWSTEKENRELTIETSVIPMSSTSNSLEITPGMDITQGEETPADGEVCHITATAIEHEITGEAGVSMVSPTEENEDLKLPLKPTTPDSPGNPASVVLDGTAENGDVFMESPVDNHNTSLDMPKETRTNPTPADSTDAEPATTTTESAPQAEEVSNKKDDKRQVATAAQMASKTAKPKLQLTKRQPTVGVAFGRRVTRSSSNQQKAGIPAAQESGPSQTKSNIPTATKRAAATGAVKKVAPARVAGSSVAGPSKKIISPVKATHEQPTQKKPPFVSPMKVSSPVKEVRPPKTPTKTPRKTLPRFTFSNKPISSPSPAKIARSSIFTKPISSITSRSTFSMDSSQVSLATASSLSTLSNALEKLSMPAPSRPTTSMGFNREMIGEEGPARSMDDTSIRRKSIGMGLPGGIQRASTLGADAFKSTATVATVASSSNETSKSLVQKPLSAYMNKAAGKSGVSSRTTAKTAIIGGKPPRPLFGVGGIARKIVSKKSALPTVIGSPVKGDGDVTMQEYEMEEESVVPADNSNDNFLAPDATSSSMLTLDDLTSIDKGKDKATEHSTTSRSSNASRRVSMVSHALTQSLNMPPPPLPAPKGSMGPPATPPRIRSTSSTYPATSAGGSSPSRAPVAPTRASARIAKTAPGNLSKIRGGTDGHISSQRKAPAESVPPVNPAVEALKVLKDCTIYVDVKTEDGEEAGSLFVEMLEGVGARVLTRVGQTCTHIVFKNGLPSTVTRYKLLRDPKPKVIGIAWVVECVEQRKHLDETEYLIDLENTHVSGNHKRRRSLLPKMFTSELSSEADKDETEGDRSIDGSTSSIMLDDDIAPLERARRRLSIVPGGAKP